MNCYLMAAGKSKRLSPLTNRTPKCLLPINGKPLLRWWLDALFGLNCCDKVFVNLHHCAHELELWIQSYFMETGCYVYTIDERRNLLGTAGTLYWHANEGSDFLLGYTDTYFQSLYQTISRSYKMFLEMPKSSIAGFVSMNSRSDSAGKFEFDGKGNITGFREKSKEGIVAWSGLMYGRPSFFNYLRRSDYDLAYDVFPRIYNKIRVISHANAFDIGRSVDEYETLKRKFKGT